jgi:hypothetical protein
VGGQTDRSDALGETLIEYMCHHGGPLMGRAKPHARRLSRIHIPIIQHISNIFFAILDSQLHAPAMTEIISRRIVHHCIMYK